ncbi:MAG: phytoene desaturase [Betaproteobacteria bacterium]|nr:phytoene desaturase [Betaproteobacteria bacterium]
MRDEGCGRWTQPAPRDHAVVVGAGMGGLACALSLAQRGLQVTLLEAASGPGGKMQPLQVGGASIDAGPTVFTMRWVFEQLFEQAGASFADRVPCEPLNILARHGWRDQDARLDLYARSSDSAEAIAAFSSPAEARRFDAFCREARRLYRHLEGPYIRSERPTMLSLMKDLGPGGLWALTGLGPFQSLWASLSRRFADPRLQQLFGRYATYCGASPWQAPATLMLIAQVEMDGVWAVRGGMGQLARALAELAGERGVVQRYGTRVSEVLVAGGRARGVKLESGETLDADTVVFNGDVNALAQGRLGAAGRSCGTPRARSERSLSALTWSIRAPTQGWPLTRHNVFFDHDYQSEFEDIFGHARFPQRPTVYVCAQDRHDQGLVDRGLQEVAERLLVLVNAPACADEWPGPDQIREQEMLSCQERTFELLSACGLQVHRNQGMEQRMTPWDFEQRYPSSAGSLYGPATHGWMSAFRRGSARTPIPGLFLAGGSVHPGPGVPMATMSGRLAAETVMAHLDSTSLSRRVVISGGISMRSAMTAGMP